MRSNVPALLAVVLSLATCAVGCDALVTSSDDGGHDAGREDAAPTDGGRIDGGEGDGGEGDAGQGDGGQGDAGEVDGGGPRSCASVADCEAAPSECVEVICAAELCGTEPSAAGRLIDESPGDCRARECDGEGAIVDVVDDADLPVDDDECTVDVCTAGVASNPPAAAGTSCGSGAALCDGAGACVGCLVADDCPGSDTECEVRTCVAGTCGMSFTASGTPLAAQTAGDCSRDECDGAGGVTSADDDADVDDDGNECTSDACSGGASVTTNLAIGTACGSAGLTCDGAGACVECTTTADCETPANACLLATCVAGTCGSASRVDGTSCSDGDACTQSDFCQAGACTGANPVLCTVADECHEQGVCDSATGICSTPSRPDGSPCSDGNACTLTDGCQAGSCTGTNPVVCTALDQCHDAGVCSGATGLCSNPNASDGTICSDGRCAAGACLECSVAADCPGVDTECRQRTCSSNACGVSNTPAGTATSMGQTSGDCVQQQCDGAGAVVVANDGSDIPDDGLQCTVDACMAGVASHAPAAAGTACSQTGGTECDGAGACVVPEPGHLVINEIDYDQVASDSAEFVEIYNGTGAAVSLAGFSLVLANGSTNTTYLTLSLASAGTLAAGQYLVVASSSLIVPPTALRIAFALAADNMQNGAPDGVALVNTATGTLVDALSYEGGMMSVTVTGVTGSVSLIEGAVLPAATADSNTAAGSLARLPNGTDANNAATDWSFTSTSTPGLANL